jgi:cephalosporin hydroxylase
MEIPQGMRDTVKKFIPDSLLKWRRQRLWHRKEEKERRIIREFHKLYYPNLIHSAFWLGVQTIKFPFDCWIYQEIIFRTRPDLIIETGVYYGGSTLYLASILDLLGHGSIVAIDIDLSQVHEKTRDHPRVTLLEGSSVDPAIVQQVADMARGKRTMVVLDSDHSAPHVLKELTTYGDMVSSGCYLICEDTNLNGNPVFSPWFSGPGPFEAVQEFLQLEGAHWEVDREAEKFMLTANPGGFLIKK